jgi:hypothetical protein
MTLVEHREPKPKRTTLQKFDDIEFGPKRRVRALTYTRAGATDVRTVSGHFLASLSAYWEIHGDRLLHEIGKQHPELILMSLTKLAQVQRIELGKPGDFSGLSKGEIIAKLEERAGPQAAKLFTKFVKDMSKLRDGDPMPALSPTRE